MVKCLIRVVVASVLSCGIAFATDKVSIEGKEKITRNGVNIFLEPNSANKQKYLNGEFDKTLEAMKKAYEANKNNKVMKAPAPAVYYVAVLGVVSEQGGREELAENQTATNNDHGGNPFVVHTLVLGYGGGSNDRAKFAGNEAVQLSSEGMDYTGDNIIDGWYDIWDISKPANSSGTFEFTSRSINAPGNSMSTSVQIR